MPPPTLTRDALADDPLDQFHRWLADAEATGMVDPNAMTVATAGADGRPSARTILLQCADAEGFRFYTNRESLKGLQLAENPRAQLLFFWRELGRQILVHGAVAPTTDADSDEYFTSRPRTSRLGAIASRQGRVIAERQDLLDAVAAADAAYPGDDVPRPAGWGGYRVIPEAIEFWQAGEFRLHDRFVYTPDPAAGGWRIERLSP